MPLILLTITLYYDTFDETVQWELLSNSDLKYGYRVKKYSFTDFTVLVIPQILLYCTFL